MAHLEVREHLLLKVGDALPHRDAVMVRLHRALACRRLVSQPLSLDAYVLGMPLELLFALLLTRNKPRTHI